MLTENEWSDILFVHPMVWRVPVNASVMMMLVPISSCAPLVVLGMVVSLCAVLLRVFLLEQGSLTGRIVRVGIR